MTQNAQRGSKKPWSWKLLGLLQIGNAVAFGVVAATVDFSKEASGEQIAVSTSPTDESADDAAETRGDAPSPGSALSDAVNATVDTSDMPTFAIDPTSPAAEPTPPADPSAFSAGSSNAAVSSSPNANYVEPVLAAPVLVNPASNKLEVRCVVNGELVELKPGERRTLSGGDTWVVRFHRGGEFGAAVEPIYDGTHQFVVGQRGWKLERTDDAR